MTTQPTKRPHRWRRRFLWLGATVLRVRAPTARAVPAVAHQPRRAPDRLQRRSRSASLSLLGLSLHLGAPCATASSPRPHRCCRSRN